MEAEKIIVVDKKHEPATSKNQYAVTAGVHRALEEN
jgi:hypothetical protein